MATYPDFDIMIGTWADWYAGQNGTTVGGVATTDYSPYPQLASYQQYQIGVGFDDIAYDAGDHGVSVNNTPQEGELTNWNNDTDGADSFVYMDSFSIQQTFTWTMLTALTSTSSLTAEVNVPVIAAKFGGSASATLTLTATDAVTVQNTYSHTSSETIQVPPQCCLTAQSMLWLANFNIPYTAQIAFSGYVAVWTEDPVNGHYLWFKPLPHVLSDIVANDLWPAEFTSLYVPGSDDLTIYYQAQGVFTGQNGWIDKINTEQYPVGQCPSMIRRGQRVLPIRRRLVAVTGQIPGEPARVAARM